jgi:hypothetical protein
MSNETAFEVEVRKGESVNSIKVTARNLTGRAVIELTHNHHERPPLEAKFGKETLEANYHLGLSWWGHIEGQPDGWSETWYWVEDASFTDERLSRNAPDPELVAATMAELTSKIPDGF